MTNHNQSNKGHAWIDNLTKVINQKTGQASPECTHPIRGLESQTSYPRVHTARQAIPGFNGINTLDKRGTAEPLRESGRGGKKEREGTVRR